MRKIKKFENWVSTTSGNSIPEYDYTTKNKTTYGVHIVSLINPINKIHTEVKAKFDTGARTSSIDFNVAERLGFDNEMLSECKELDKMEINKNITKAEQRQIEKKYTAQLTQKYNEITSVQISKSSSGFSIRAYVKLDIDHNGIITTTEVNLRDRSGLSCEMLIGLNDML